MSTLEYPSATPADSQHTRGNWFPWAIYLAMSWTWCIGMFLPVLIVRDFGFWGWVVFAIPNVIGAAAVGWINRTAEQSERTVVAHLPMMTAFSWVTAAFQIFFGFWIFLRLPTNPLSMTSMDLLFVSFAFLGVALPAAIARRAGAGLAVFVLAFSALCMAELWHDRMLATLDHPLQVFALGASPRVIGLAAATSFGFLLCPHLDLTFHRVRQQLSASGAQMAFGIGLGLIFLLMILCSLLYAYSAIYAMWTRSWFHYLVFPLLLYWTVQLGFTVGVHWNGGKPFHSRRDWVRFAWIVITTLLAGLLAVLATRTFPEHAGLESGEVIYRIFLASYGLVFPAYVWLCMLPGRWVAPPTKQQWIVLALAVLIASPFFWMSFIERQMIWIGPGLAIPILARLLIRFPRLIPIQQ